MITEKDLFHSEEFFENLVNAVREPIIILDHNLKIIYANGSFYEFFLVTPEETMGEKIYDLGNKQWDIPGLRELLENILPEKTSFDDYEVEHDFSSIGRRVMLLNARQIEQAKGKERIILLIVEDITERHDLRLTLEDSEERFRRLFETSQDGLMLFDKETSRIVNANQSICDLLEQTKDAIIGKQFSELYLSKNFAEFPEIIKELDISGVVCQNRLLLMPQKKNQGKLVADVHLVDKSRFVQCNVRDISARVEAANIHELNEQRLESLIALHSLTDLSEEQLLNHSLEEAVRLTRSKVGYFHLIADDEKTTISFQWSQETMKFCTAPAPAHYSIDQGGIWTDCIRLRKAVIHNDYPDYPEKKGLPEGHFTLLRHMNVPIIVNSKIVAVIGVGNKENPYDDADARQLTLFFSSTWDIIQQKRSDQLNKHLEAGLQEAQKMEAIGTLAGGIAHDFNNILSIIIGYTDLLKEDALPGSHTREDLATVLIAANRAKELVKQILAFSRQATIDRVAIQIQPLIKEGLKMLRSSIPTTININDDIDPQCGVILADITQVHQVLMNLCTNAYQAMETTGGTLSVAVKTTFIGKDDQGTFPDLLPGEYVEMTVTDTGEGIGPDVIGNIFNPFFTTKEVGKGTGMGLAIIHGIIKEHSGTITVESLVGQGTTFHVYFPVVSAIHEPETKESGDNPRGQERILFIDDEKDIARMGKKMLERLGYHVTVMCDSIKALKAFRNTPEEFDLVITDQTMPGMTGTDLAKRMLQIRPDIPIILCTGYSSLIDESSANVLGIKKFTFKPITLSTISRIIRKALDDEPNAVH